MEKRGKFLTVLIIIGALLGPLSYLYNSTNTEAAKSLYGYIPSWWVLYYIFMFLLGAGAIIGIWMWKKLGAYLLTLSYLIAVFVEIFILQPQQYGGFIYISQILMGGLWFWALSRKWSHFK